MVVISAVVAVVVVAIVTGVCYRWLVLRSPVVCFYFFLCCWCGCGCYYGYCCRCSYYIIATRGAVYQSVYICYNLLFLSSSYATCDISFSISNNATNFH